MGSRFDTRSSLPLSGGDGVVAVGDMLKYDELSICLFAFRVPLTGCYFVRAVILTRHPFYIAETKTTEAKLIYSRC